MRGKPIRVKRPVGPRPLVTEITDAVDRSPSRIWLWLPLMQVVFFAGGVQLLVLSRAPLSFVLGFMTAGLVTIGVAAGMGGLLYRLDRRQSNIERFTFLACFLLTGLATLMAPVAIYTETAFFIYFMLGIALTIGVQLVWGGFLIMTGALAAWNRHRAQAELESARDEGVPLYPVADEVAAAAATEKSAVVAARATQILRERTRRVYALDTLNIWLVMPMLAVAPAATIIALAAGDARSLVAMLIVTPFPALLLYQAGERFLQLTDGEVSVLPFKGLAVFCLVASIGATLFQLGLGERLTDGDEGQVVTVQYLMIALALTVILAVIERVRLVRRQMARRSAKRWDE